MVGNAAKSIFIPDFLITDETLTNKRISIFLFMQIKCGLDETVGFSIDQIINWCGFKPDRHINGMNDQFIQILSLFEEKEYFKLSTDLFKKTKFQTKKGNIKEQSSISTSALITSNINTKISDSFAILYLDEIYKILNYKKNNDKNTTLNASIILLVFAYLRWKIPKYTYARNTSTNVVKDEYIRNNPEVYDSYYKEMAKEIGIYPATFSKAVKILKELGFIYYDDSLPRVKYMDKFGEQKWRRDIILFANMYKRQKNKNNQIELVAYGEKYYLFEINNKKNKLEKLKLLKENE